MCKLVPSVPLVLFKEPGATVLVVVVPMSAAIGAYLARLCERLLGAYDGNSRIHCGRARHKIRKVSYYLDCGTTYPARAWGLYLRFLADLQPSHA